MRPKEEKASNRRARLVLATAGLAVAGLIAVQLPELVRYIKMARM